MSSPDRPLRPIWHLLPSGLSVPFVALGTAWLLLFGSCTGVVAVSEVATGKGSLESLTGLAGILGLILVPVAAILLFVSALLAGRWAARGLLFAVTLATLLFGWLALVLTAIGADDPVADIVLPTILYAVPVGVVLVALVVSALLGARDVRAGVSAARRERVAELLAARGELDYATVASETGLEPAGVGAYLETLREQGEIAAELDAEAKMAFSPTRYEQKQRDLVSVVWGRGKASLAQLATELRLSPRRLHDLLVAAMQAGTFTGFVDARGGEVVSSAAVELQRGRSCPSCGGQMDLAGHGLVVCRYCQAEIFLPAK
jgi:hypothetical protein